ncbi:hypothetical protein YK48G_06330 [Lentilactobacillus fungorum]|uniref:Uncharacterized protein n=1 Tax=Lentilactobacillus fungorum TaxID=2201250 RepID=A0ABQ3VXU0_9LACO|nr:hypothetical protein YK48G_06330 [Lentilactobacillus fungorum]
MGEFEAFLDQLQSKATAKLYATIHNIEINGLRIAQRQKWVKKIGINRFEIRSKQSSNIRCLLSLGIKSVCDYPWIYQENSYERN